MTTIRAADLPRLSLPWLALLALPMVGLAVLIARPQLDLEWRHQPSHFWLVLSVAVVSLALAYLTNEAAMRRGDARLVLISLAFGASAGFLGLHALATPGVLLPSPNLGFVIATPVGLTIAAGPGGRGGAAARRAATATSSSARAGFLRGALLARSRGMGRCVDPRGPGVHGAGRAGRGRAAAPAGRRSWRSPCTRSPRGTSCACSRGGGRPLLLAIVVALVLLAEAMVTVVFSRDWHLSWWEWHLLMAVAFARGRVRRADRVPARGLAHRRLRRASTWPARSSGWTDGTPRPSPTSRRRRREGRSIDRILDRLRVDGATTEELALLERAGGRAAPRRRALPAVRASSSSPTRARTDPAQAPPRKRRGARGDRPLRRSLGLHVVQRAPRTDRGGRAAQRGVDRRGARSVAAEDGLIESFTGDGLLVIFNAVGDQPDHPRRAARVRARTSRRGRGARHAAREAMPRFHIAHQHRAGLRRERRRRRAQRSFAAIGDTTNLGSRLLGAAGPGEIVVGEATWAQLEWLRGRRAPRAAAAQGQARAGPGLASRALIVPTRSGGCRPRTPRGSGHRSGTRGGPRPACRMRRGASARH